MFTMVVRVLALGVSVLLKKRHHSPEYTQYLKSQAWLHKRAEAFEVYGHKCARCGREVYLQVHHKTYAHLGNEPMSDLEVLCRWCHRREDKRRRKGLPVKSKRWR